MKAVNYDAQGLKISEVDRPVVKHSDVLIKVFASGVNRADIMQKQGKYPPPPGASEILGLEVAGIIEKVGSEVRDFKPGDAVMALLTGGGYAEYTTVHHGSVLPIPEGIEMVEAAGIMEVFLTAYQSLIELGKLAPHENILVHAGASGVGTAAIQIAKLYDEVKVVVTAGSEQKIEFCQGLGADLGINYRKTPMFDQYIHDQGFGIDLIIDFIGADYLSQNLNVLNTDGRMILLALMSGYKMPEFNMLSLLMKRLTIKGSTLRSRSEDYKTRLVREFNNLLIPHFQQKNIRPVIDSVFNWEEATKAHDYIEDNSNIGKVILQIQ